MPPQVTSRRLFLQRQSCILSFNPKHQNPTNIPGKTSDLKIENMVVFSSNGLTLGWKEIEDQRI